MKVRDFKPQSECLRECSGSREKVQMLGSPTATRF